MLNIFNNLLPFRLVDEHDIINWYSLDNTGLGGLFVHFDTGNNAPDLDPISLSNSTPGYAYANVDNYRWENIRKVGLATSGDTRYSVLGISLDATIEQDQNGLKMLFFPQRQLELQAVPSGYTIRIGTDGVYSLKSSAYSGVPFPGYVGTIHNTNPGQIQWSTYASVTNTDQIVCKAMSTSGAGFSGWAQIKLTLK